MPSIGNGGQSPAPAPIVHHCGTIYRADAAVFDGQNNGGSTQTVALDPNLNDLPGKHWTARGDQPRFDEDACSGLRKIASPDRRFNDGVARLPAYQGRG